MAKLVRDAVHGDIELGKGEIELIDTPEFQRLRGIKQLGTAYLIYPSAVHTRFEHSLGTAWMAARLVTSIRRHSQIPEDEAELIRIAALLHDITHVPFGHTLEDERRVFPRHDEDESRLSHFLEDSRVGDVLRLRGIQREVRQILSGDSGYQSDIVGGAISADLLDYLRRDAYFTGLSQNYDDRVFHLFEKDDDRLVIRVEKNGVLRHDALTELVNLLRLRYTLSERVYFHHTKLASGAMISKAVELALKSGFDPTSLLSLRDETLFYVLDRQYGSQGPGIRHLLSSLETRQLYKPCYTLTVDVGEDEKARLERMFHHDPEERERAEQALARTAGIDSHQIIVYCPSPGMSLPEAEVPVRFSGGEIRPLSGANNVEIRILKEKHRALWKFLVFVDRAAWDASGRVRGAAAEYFGLKSESGE